MKLARLDGATSNELFEMLADWNTYLEHRKSHDAPVLPCSLSGEFRKSAGRRRQQPANEQSKRLPPFSLRLSDEERQQLIAEAAGAPLGTYIKAKVLGDNRPLRMRRTGVAVEDRQALGQALAMLGRSHLASNLNQLAHLAHVGALALTPETEAELRGAYRDIRDIRHLLLVALGLRPEDGP